VRSRALLSRVKPHAFQNVQKYKFFNDDIIPELITSYEFVFFNAEKTMLFFTSDFTGRLSIKNEWYSAALLI
jgi:hypothetical protein